MHAHTPLFFFNFALAKVLFYPFAAVVVGEEKKIENESKSIGGRTF